MARDPGSFRDPCGFVFTEGGTLYRQVQREYAAEYDRLMGSGLYDALTSAGLLVSHAEAPTELAASSGAHRVLRPERIPQLSYPYEWCFSQLQDAALATLRIERMALEHGMSLKDASAYNVQFRAGAPVFIDTLSFEMAVDGRPWVAYRQFCRHFLAPLALMSYVDIRLGQLLREHLDGIPLDLAGRMLPGRTRLNPGLLMHIHLHGAAESRYSGTHVGGGSAGRGMARTALLGLLDSLEGAVRRLRWKPAGTTWAAYYANTNYTDVAMDGKLAIVDGLLGSVEPHPTCVWDLGANSGLFSRLAAERGAQTVAWDIDPAAVEQNYLQCRRDGETLMLPLLQDLTNPSPDMGWDLAERMSVRWRSGVDVVMALALIHHLAIGNNVPLDRIAGFLASLGRWLIIEFVPKGDSKVEFLLAGREDIFGGYTQDGFEAAFGPVYETVRREAVPDSSRALYLMRRRAD